MTRHPEIDMVRTIVLLVLAPAMAAGQQPAMPLKPATATVAAGFKNVTSLHELSDGTVVMTDMMVGLFGVGNFSTGRFTSIPSVSPSTITRLSGDTSLLTGIGTTNWVFLVGTRPVGMLPASNPVVAAASTLHGADLHGHVLVLGRLARHDSLPIILVSRTAATQDTIGWLSYGPHAMTDGYIVDEQTRLALDGWTAVLRKAPYRVDWRSPDGRWTLGAPIPVAVVQVDDREKAVVMTRRAMGGTPQPPEIVTNWPAAVPPFTTFRSMVTLDGKLIVRRTATADHPEGRYDIIDHHGAVERQVTMPANEHIVGFGANSVYVAVDAKDGAQVIQRHPWP
jgi:hypothetical protein